MSKRVSPTERVLFAIRAAGRAGLSHADLKQAARTGNERRKVIVAGLADAGLISFDRERRVFVALAPLADPKEYDAVIERIGRVATAAQDLRHPITAQHRAV